MNAIHAVTEVRDHADQVHQEPLQVGESIPAVCTIADMCRIFRCGSASTFYRRERAGEFRKFQLQGGGKHEWSGYRIARFLTGDSFAITVKRS